MKLDRLALVTAVALGAAACAADRNKEVKSAETHLSSAQLEARNDEARLNRKQAQEQAAAQRKPMTADERAKLQTKEIEERAAVKAKGAKEIADAKKDVTDAQASMEDERTKVEADAEERLTKAEAQRLEANTKSARLPALKRAQLNAEMNTFDGKKVEVENRLKDLSRTPNEGWNDAKAKLDKSLSDLENIAKRF